MRSAALLGWLVVACGGGGSAGDVSAIEVGTGLTTFEPLGSGAPVELVHGPQGGWHVQVTLRLWSAAPDGLDLQYEVRRAGEDALVSAPNGYLVAESDLLREDDHWLRLGDRAILAIADGSEIVGAEVTIRAFVSASGDPVEDTGTGTVVDLE